MYLFHRAWVLLRRYENSQQYCQFSTYISVQVILKQVISSTNLSQAHSYLPTPRFPKYIPPTPNKRKHTSTHPAYANPPMKKSPCIFNYPKYTLFHLQSPPPINKKYPLTPTNYLKYTPYTSNHPHPSISCSKLSVLVGVFVTSS